MIKHQKSRFILGNRWFSRSRIVQGMEAFQDLIVVLLCIGLFCIMMIQLWDIFISLIYPIHFNAITSDILFLLILVELFRLLIIYLQEHNVAVGVAVEVSIVSILREVIVHGALEINWLQLLSICCLLSILGALLLVCTQVPQSMFEKYRYRSVRMRHSVRYLLKRRRNDYRIPRLYRYGVTNSESTTV
jgi:uncharacterized membrane protein (DUF373 family)